MKGVGGVRQSWWFLDVIFAPPYKKHCELVGDMCRHIKNALRLQLLFPVYWQSVYVVAIVLCNKHTLMCVHVCAFVDKSGGKLACWDCPTAFPVFIQHPYSAPVCLATGSHQEQTRWANMLQPWYSSLIAVPNHEPDKFPHVSMPPFPTRCLDCVSSVSTLVWRFTRIQGPLRSLSNRDTCSGRWGRDMMSCIIALLFSAFYFLSSVRCCLSNISFL